MAIIVSAPSLKISAGRKWHSSHLAGSAHMHEKAMAASTSVYTISHHDISRSCACSKHLEKVRRDAAQFPKILLRHRVSFALEQASKCNCSSCSGEGDCFKRGTAARCIGVQRFAGASMRLALNLRAIARARRMSSLTHIDRNNMPTMVDVSAKVRLLFNSGCGHPWLVCLWLWTVC